jgi:hypothetical protein
MRLFRFEVVESFLSGGIALAKVDALRPLLEKYGHRLTNRAHLSELIPAVLENEKDKLKKELKDVKEASVIFDGSLVHSGANFRGVQYLEYWMEILKHFVLSA